ncbi:acetate/propionate family kinase [Pararhizobium sp. LjRoot235]|uniref:acetate/propionate family kinase n=1 Tax=Pararhizobium sp. LjRoot235 TaxID=3342291 RepID=UPI003ECD0477
MKETLLLTFNAGSSTVKIGIYKVGGGKPRRIGKAVVDFAFQARTLHLKEGPAQFDLPLKADAGDDLLDLTDEVLRELGVHFDLDAVTTAGHRIVHGGDVFSGPVELDTKAIAEITALTKLAPLHQPQALRLVNAVKHLRPHLFQTASFDTTFHATQADLVRRLAIPRAYHDQGIKRYGFHGLSYRHVAGELTRKAPDVSDGKVVMAHLGSGASLCAIEKGISRDSSMGFSTLDGIPMATRPGWLDPGVLLHFLGPLGKSVKEVEDMLYYQSGLLGVSGLSGDIRNLVMDGGVQAKEAIDLFTLRIAGEVARLASTLGGLDALVFTAGIGENQPKIRALICERLLWLGVEVDPVENENHAWKISSSTSRVAVFVVPTDEEQTIAEEALSVARNSAK